MELVEIESCIIECIEKNIRDSEEDVPRINSSTSVFNGIPGFDSLRSLEVLIGLEDLLKCELPPDKVFVKRPPKTEDIHDLAVAVSNIISEANK